MTVIDSEIFIGLEGRVRKMTLKRTGAQSPHLNYIINNGSPRLAESLGPDQEEEEERLSPESGRFESPRFGEKQKSFFKPTIQITQSPNQANSYDTKNDNGISDLSSFLKKDIPSPTTPDRDWLNMKPTKKESITWN